MAGIIFFTWRYQSKKKKKHALNHPWTNITEFFFGKKTSQKPSQNLLPSFHQFTWCFEHCDSPNAWIPGVWPGCGEGMKTRQLADLGYFASTYHDREIYKVPLTSGFKVGSVWDGFIFFWWVGGPACLKSHLFLKFLFTRRPGHPQPPPSSWGRPRNPADPGGFGQIMTVCSILESKPADKCLVQKSL